MTTDTTFVGAKGGVGTSTVAALYALQVSRSGQPVHLTATDAASVQDLAAILGVPTPSAGHVVEAAPRLTLGEARGPQATNIVDACTDCFSDHTGRVLLVLRNDYQSLRRALGAPRTTAGLVLVSEPKRALGRRDVEDVLATPIVAELHLDPSVARTIDAGLLTGVRSPFNLALLADTVPTR